MDERMQFVARRLAGEPSRLAILRHREQRIAGCFGLKRASLHGRGMQRSHFILQTQRRGPEFGTQQRE
jgi:hypothetical protein